LGKGFYVQVFREAPLGLNKYKDQTVVGCAITPNTKTKNDEYVPSAIFHNQ